MKRLMITICLTVGVSLTAHADIWRWVDMNGHDHYVTTNKPIYTWLDRYGDVHFSDKPDHPSAVRANLIWHSSGSSLPEPPGNDGNEDGANPDESPEMRAQRLAAEAYYCGQAKDIYETYRSAPQLYRTLDDGKRYYLTVAEMAEALAEAEANVESFCN